MSRVLHEILPVEPDHGAVQALQKKSPPLCLRQFIGDGVLLLPEEWRDFPEALSIKGAHELVSLGNLRSVNGGLYIWDCVNLHDFGDLKVVRGPVDCQNCPKLEDVSHLEQVRGFIDLEDSRVSILPTSFRLVPLMPILKPFIRLSHANLSPT
jgi:hypothetical protein